MVRSSTCQELVELAATTLLDLCKSKVRAKMSPECETIISLVSSVVLSVHSFVLDGGTTNCATAVCSLYCSDCTACSEMHNVLDNIGFHIDLLCLSLRSRKPPQKCRGLYCDLRSKTRRYARGCTASWRGKPEDRRLGICSV